MVRSAIDDEASVQRLTSALRANVAGWDGNLDAINKNIEAGMRLGFTDDDLRESLAFLTGATHDIGKAQEIQSTAMDLARFKGIDLKSATEALVKVEAGRFRILASLGIQLKAGATQTEALAAVQAIAAGQLIFGENRVQEAAAKWPELRARHAGIELHLIGPLQSNKVKEAVALLSAQASGGDDDDVG